MNRFSKIFAVALIGFTAPIITLSPSLVAVAAAQANMPAAIALHNAGRDGDTDATEQAVAAFNALIKTQPGNAKAVAYLGSSYALTARDARSVTDKIRYTNRGLRFLDQAATMAPNDFVVRIIRANVTGALPAMFGRTETTVEDMLTLDQMFTRAQSPAMAGPMVGIYAQLVEIAPDQGDWAGKASAARAMLAGN